MFEAALSPVITAQINMDLDNMVLPTSDGQKDVRECDDSFGCDLGYAPHNVPCTMKMKLKTSRTNNGVLTWEKDFPRVCEGD